MISSPTKTKKIKDRVLFKKIIHLSLFYVHLCFAYMFICGRVSDSLDSEIYTVMSCHVEAGN